MTTQILPSNGSADRLIEAARNGDDQAMGDALQTCRRYLMRIAREELHSELRAKEDASDIVQTTLLKAQKNFQQFAGTNRETLNGWLKQILLNVLRDVARKYQATKKRGGSGEVSFNDSSKIKINTGLYSPDPTPSEFVMARERQEALARAMEQLPTDQRQVIFLRSQQHLDFAKIGQKMDRTSEAARLLWTRAVKRLAEELKRDR